MAIDKKIARDCLALLVCIFIVALILCSLASYLPYNIDELDYLQLAWHIKNQGWQFGKDYITGEQTSLLPSFLTSLISIVGDGGVFRFRIVFLSFTIISTIVFYYLLRLILHGSTALTWAICVLLAISTNAVASKGFEVRNEPLQLLLFALSLLVAEFWIRTSKPFWALILGISSSLFFWLKFTIAPYFLFIFAVSLFYSKRRILFAGLFAFAIGVSSGLILYKELSFYLPYLKDFLDTMSKSVGMLPSNQGLLDELALQPWYWTFVIIIGLFSLAVVKIGDKRFAFMTVLPSFVYLLSLKFKRLVFPQDFVLPAFGLSFGAAVVFQYLMFQRKKLALYFICAISVVVILLNFKSTNTRINRDFLPNHPNPFILYHRYISCADNRPLSLTKFKRCFYDLLNADPYNYGRYRRSQQEALARFIKICTSSGDLSVSASVLNVFNYQSPAWVYGVKAQTFEYEPYHILKLLEKSAFFMKFIELREVSWVGMFEVKNGKLYYDFHSDLKSNTPKLIIADAFIVDRLILDEDAAKFIEDNYSIIYHPPSQSFVAVHKLLGRKLLRKWEETRLAEGEADRLVFMAVEKRGDPIELARQALVLEPNHPEANFIVGQNLFRLGKLQEAKDYLVKAIKASKFRDADAMRMALSAGLLEPRLESKCRKELKKVQKHIGGPFEILYTRKAR